MGFLDEWRNNEANVIRGVMRSEFLLCGWGALDITTAGEDIPVSAERVFSAPKSGLG